MKIQALMNKRSNFHNIEPLEDGSYEIPIYRFIPLKYLQDILINKILKISQTKSWDDTYENFLGKVEFHVGANKVSYQGFIYDFYGQCWTLKKESDALWRIYSHDKEGVRIKSTIQKLMNVITYGNEILPKKTRANIIGKVEYHTEEKIKNWVLSLKNVDLVDMSKSLFIKRPEFQHEEEVRLIIHKFANQEDDVRGIKRPFLNFEFNPFETIDEITFDPRVTDEDFKRNKLILEKLGFKKKINQSNLYHFQPIERPL